MLEWTERGRFLDRVPERRSYKHLMGEIGLGLGIVGSGFCFLRVWDMRYGI